MPSHKIRHIAIFAKDQETTVRFYKETFGLYEVARPVEPGKRRGIFLSDGYINLAILPGDEKREGIHHFGFQCDVVPGVAAEDALLLDFEQVAVRVDPIRDPRDALARPLRHRGPH